MSDTALKVENRKETGKEFAKKLRYEGKIPAIIYASKEDSVMCSVNAHELELIIRKESNIIDVILEGGKVRKTIIREVQRDPVTNHLLHVDLLGIKLDEKVRMSIPVQLTGVPVGVKVDGGILEHPLREVEVEGLPLDIPDHLVIDVADLKIGDVMTLEKIPADKFEFITETHHPVAMVIQPKVAKVDEPSEEELEGEEGEGEEAESSGEE
jgi:large subunit ribosomal protein L25